MTKEIPNTSPIRRSGRSRRKPSKFRDEATDGESDDVPLCSYAKATPTSHAPGQGSDKVTQNVTFNQEIATNGIPKRRGRPRKMRRIEKPEKVSHTEAETKVAEEECSGKDVPHHSGDRDQRRLRGKQKVNHRTQSTSASTLRIPGSRIGDTNGVQGEVPRDEERKTISTRRSLRGLKSVNYSQLTKETDAEEDSVEPDTRKNHKKRRKRAVSEIDQEMFKDVLTSIEDKLTTDGVIECHLCKKRKLTSQYAFIQHLKHNCPDSKYLQREHDTKAVKIKPLTSLNRLEFSKLARKHGGRIECPNENCNRSFTTVDGLRYHKKRCGKELEMNLSCEYCGKKYASWAGLSHHLRSWHTNIKPTATDAGDPADPGGEAPRTDTSDRGKRGAAKKAIEKLHEIAEKVGTREEGSVIEDSEFYKEMASTKTILKLFKAPSSYRASSDDAKSWNLEIKHSGSVSCPFCKKTFHSLNSIKLHTSCCKLRPGGDGVFTCLHCETECKSKKRMLHHLRKSHEEIVNTALKEALEEKKTQWEGLEEVEEEYEQEEEAGGETDEDDLIKSNEEEIKRDHKRYYFVQDKQPIKWTQDFHQKCYCSGKESLFHQWIVDPKEWVELSESVGREYHPTTKESAAFMIEECNGTTSSKRGECKVLPLYGSISTAGKGVQLVFFVGGPVWAMDWCPSKPGDVQDDYVAISCYKEMNHLQFYDQVEPYPGLIQIWNLGNLKNRMVPPPTMALGIAHDFGYTNAIQWCPSGGYQSSDVTNSEGRVSHRLGLLAAACSVGHVVVYAIPHPDQRHQQQSIYRPDPVAVLKPSRSDHWFGQCLCVDWSRQKGHSKIAAGFGNGCVAIWNICTTSQLLIDHSNNIYPFQLLYVGHTLLSGVSLNPSDDHYLLVVGSDRHTSIWDTKNPDCPINDSSQCTSVDCSWPLYHNMGLVSTEKTGSSSKGCTVYMLDSGILSFNSTVITLNDTVWSFSISDWLHCVAAGAEDGKVGMTMYSIDGRNFKPGSKAMVVSIMTVEDIPATMKKQRKEKQEINIEINQEIKTSNHEHDKNDTKDRNNSYEGNSAMVTLSDDLCERTRDMQGNISDSIENATGNMCNSIKNTVENDCDSITKNDISDSTRNIEGNISDSLENTTGNMCNSIKITVENDCNSITKNDISDRIKETTREEENKDNTTMLDASRSAYTEDSSEVIHDGSQSVNEQLKSDVNERNFVEEQQMVDKTQEVNGREPTAETSNDETTRTRLSEPAKAGMSSEKQTTKEGCFEPKNLDEDIGSRKHSSENMKHENTSKENDDAKTGQQAENQTDDDVPPSLSTVESSVQSEEPPVEENEEPPVKANEKKTESRSPKGKKDDTQKTELCIEDKDFDVKKILRQGDTNNERDDINGTMLKDQDMLKYKSKITSWRGKYDVADSEKCVVYKDYLENFLNSASWKSASRTLLSRNLKSKDPEEVFPLNAVTKLVWSPNYHSRQWLLIAGSNGVVRAIHFKCFDFVRT